jgi:Ca2+:H+ antiporter
VAYSQEVSASCVVHCSNDRFIGLILLPLVGNAAEHVTSVWMACKGKMELTIGVAVGSSIQIAAGMIPLLVLIAWPLQKDLTLFFVSFW